jgi:hypothetical protein
MTLSGSGFKKREMLRIASTKGGNKTTSRVVHFNWKKGFRMDEAKLCIITP